MVTTRSGKQLSWQPARIKTKEPARASAVSKKGTGKNRNRGKNKNEKKTRQDNYGSKKRSGSERSSTASSATLIATGTKMSTTEDSPSPLRPRRSPPKVVIPSPRARISKSRTGSKQGNEQPNSISKSKSNKAPAVASARSKGRRKIDTMQSFSGRSPANASKGNQRVVQLANDDEQRHSTQVHKEPTDKRTTTHSLQTHAHADNFARAFLEGLASTGAVRAAGAKFIEEAECENPPFSPSANPFKQFGTFNVFQAKNAASTGQVSQEGRGIVQNDRHQRQHRHPFWKGSTPGSRSLPFSAASPPSPASLFARKAYIPADQSPIQQTTTKATLSEMSKFSSIPTKTPETVKPSQPPISYMRSQYQSSEGSSQAHTLEHNRPIHGPMRFKQNDSGDWREVELSAKRKSTRTRFTKPFSQDDPSRHAVASRGRMEQQQQQQQQQQQLPLPRSAREASPSPSSNLGTVEE